MLLIPLEEGNSSIAQGFRKAPVFVFIDKEKGIVFQENHYKHEKSELFFENFKNYDVDTIYVKGLGYKTYLKLDSLGIAVYFIEDVEEFTHIDPDKAIQIRADNAEELCLMGHKKA